jgi:hypothetical protein
LLPNLTGQQVLFIEPWLEAIFFQAVVKLPHGLFIFVGVAQENLHRDGRLVSH